MSSERLRQREVHRYYQAWLESSVGFQDNPISHTTRFHSDGSQLNSSKDVALTAFAQLACLKLNVKRGIVTMISTTRQYILAEATIDMSLISSSRTDDKDSDVWFGNASFPRGQGVSGSALTPPDYTARSPSGDSFAAPALVINDLAKHDHFRTRGYAGNGVSFYCGIPIVTKDGSPIGVFSISHDQPRNGLQPHELRYLHDLSLIIMRHFDTVKNEAARFRGELMVLGLGQFVQGASTVATEKSFRTRLPSPQSRLEVEAAAEPRHFKGMTITAADPLALRAISGSRTPTTFETVTPHREVVDAQSPAQVAQLSKGLPAESPTRVPRTDSGAGKLRSARSTGSTIFSRAANILRECCGADGVLFFDAVSTNLAKRSSTTGFRSANQSSQSEGGEQAYPNLQREHSSDSHASANADSEDVDSNDEGVKTCELLGFSVDVTEQTQQSTKALKRLAMTETILRRLIRRYPQGKIFYLSPEDAISSSENEANLSSAASETCMTVPEAASTLASPGIRGKPFKAKFAEELKRLVPQAQSVVWLPMWDFSKQRWSAGAFLWTKMAEQLIVDQNDLVYLRTFANSIMIEVARQDAASADETKATFIANISHELRSPLHGVVGSCELLKDTEMDEYQASLVKAIELCGKTLNDTVDHVLDYTKINQFMKRGAHLAKPGSVKQGRQKVPAVDRTMLEDHVDLAVLIQDAVESVCASQSSHHQRLRGQSMSAETAVDTSTEATNPGAVEVIFKLAHQDSWWVQTQPGAIKRILTNLVQNALKYTDAGTVIVGLSLRDTSLSRLKRETRGDGPVQEQDVTITVTDTGRGMSNDFVRNHAFTPFSQESSFSDGTGLGLSIVQLIVDSLGGRIELKSNPDVGTEINIHLKVQCKPSSDALPGDHLRSIVAKTTGKSMCLLHRAADTTVQGSAFDAAISDTAATWFGLQITRSTTLTDSPKDFYLYTSTPKADNILRLIVQKSLPSTSILILFVYNALEKLEVGRSLEGLKQRGIILEIGIHPVGPQKLGDLLSKCISRRERTVASPATTSVALPTGIAQGGTTTSPEGQVEPFETVSAEESASKAPQTGQRDETLSSPRRRAVRPRVQSPTTAPKMPQSAQDTHDRADTAGTGGSSSVTMTLDPTLKRVLLVDDNAINLNILKAAMKKGKFAFATANDGLEALEAFKQAARTDSEDERPFTHVLMDISMPVMDGIESTRLIRQFEKAQETIYRRDVLRSRSARSDRGPSTLKRSQLDVTPVEEEHDGSDDEYTTSDYVESLPMSPIEQTEFNFTPSIGLRTRPVLSQTQVAGEPARAMTYVATDDRSTQFDFMPGTRKNRLQRATIIALSGVALEQTQKDMFTAGADMFFAKPIKLNELIKLLNEPSSPDK